MSDKCTTLSSPYPMQARAALVVHGAWPGTGFHRGLHCGKIAFVTLHVQRRRLPSSRRHVELPRGAKLGATPTGGTLQGTTGRYCAPSNGREPPCEDLRRSDRR